MTDQMIPAGLTHDEAQAVREWAEQALSTEVQDATVVNVARVLLAVMPPPTTTAKETPDMPDQTLDDQVRPIVAAMRAAMRRDEHAYPEAKFLADLSGYIKDLEALLPQRPTLADMTDEERFNTVGTWADVDGFHPYRAVIGGVPAPKVPVFKPTTGSLDWVRPEDVTPLPELGRAWNPGGSPPQKPAPAPAHALPDGWRLADHEKHGRVVVTRPDPDNDGEVAIIRTNTAWAALASLTWCAPDKLTYLDTDQENNDE